jgi:hypothetical protein
MHIREDQLHSQREIDRLSTALTQVQTELTRRSGAPSADSDAERRAIGRVAQLARAEARDQALAALAEHDPRDQAQNAPPITFEDSQQRVRSAFAAETVDAEWSPDAERKLEGIVRSHLPTNSRLNSLACRSSMCEVQVTHADAKAQADFLMTGFRGWPGSLFVTAEKPEHGEIAVTIIAAREGTEPPIAPR